MRLAVVVSLSAMPRLVTAVTCASATFVDTTLFSGHQCQVGFRRNDRTDGLVRRLVDFQKLTTVKTCCARFGADPHRALLIGLEREDASSGQRGIVDGLRSASVKFCETCFSAKPHGAVRRLRNRAHTIGRQAVKQRDCAPLMQTGYWRWRR